jgi:hypothetical protein
MTKLPLRAITTSPVIALSTIFARGHAAVHALLAWLVVVPPPLKGDRRDYERCLSLLINNFAHHGVVRH